MGSDALYAHGVYICAKMYRTNVSITRQGVDPHKRIFRSSITVWDVMEQDIKPSHATVPLRYTHPNRGLAVAQFTWTVQRSECITYWMTLPGVQGSRHSCECHLGHRWGVSAAGQIYERRPLSPTLSSMWTQSEGNLSLVASELSLLPAYLHNLNSK